MMVKPGFEKEIKQSKWISNSHNELFQIILQTNNQKHDSNYREKKLPSNFICILKYKPNVNIKSLQKFDL